LLIQPAEESYEKGLCALGQGKTKTALALLEAAIEIERRRGNGPPQARYLSYYGLCLALVRNEVREGLRYCREAITLESYNSTLRCNLGRVLLRAGRRREAHRCFARGLRLEPGHAATYRELRQMGLRRKPLLPFLARNHPINVFFGRLRQSA